ncbi:hybrid sensor histidine kinase/response regulator [Massilia pseudoviolaceinigra]|uniref:hybrid sensor histidine kinase/response regulator n=1 Tax=Massilia pseudoviolaceinigra TaxID=3057165 RepID=UPI002796A8F1|nr:ATP-binding protein [Massilia sp. CCM 9206]MDQ1918947.1 ATP-binding protein [Massilia sp. CCM 9206]
MKVRSHIALLVAAILVPIVLLSIVAISVLLAAERKAALGGMEELARATVLIMDQEMLLARATAQTLATSRSLARGDFDDFYRQAQGANAGRAMHTAFISEQGQQVFNTIRPYGAQIAAPTDLVKARVAGVFNSGGPVYSNLIKGSATKQYVVSLEYPVAIADGRRFLISQWLFSSRLNELLPAKSIPPSWLISVFDRQGITIARNKGAHQYVGQPPKTKVQQAILARHEGISRSYVREGTEMYGAWAISPTTGWSVGIGVPVVEVEHAAVKSVALIALGFVLAIVSAITGAILFSRRLVGAINKASRAADMIGQGQIPPLETLPVEEMNRLQLSLHQAGSLLRESETERNRHLAAAQSARAAAEQAQAVAEAQNQAKDEFLAMLGHELRNPLAAITSGVTLLSMPGTDAVRAGKATAIIERQTRHLVHLVDELLDAHRIVSGKLTLSKTALDLAGAVESCLASFEARGAMRSHRITCALAPAVIEADPTRLEQMVSNLLDNALKYTPEGGLIHVTVASDDGMALLSVADTGVGLSGDLLPHVFDVFVQGKVINRSKGGLGIGLAVVNSLAKQHGAILLAESAGAGLGSTFSIRFPLAAAVPATPAASRTGSAGHNGVILVIEDNRDVREMMCSLLTELGFQVLSAESGQRGIQTAVATLPDVALVDIDLPDMSGYDIARALKGDARTAAIRLIAVTGYGQESDRRAAMSSGFDGHLKKPVRIEDVLAATGLTAAP